MSAFNHQVSEKLREIAILLQAQQANPFRSQAYFNAANTLDNLHEDVEQLVQSKGFNGLTALPDIGPRIAQSIYEYVAMGRISRLENLKGESDPVQFLQTIPGVGPALAQRIYDTLHVDSLEALHRASRNNQLDQVEGLGVKRKEAIQDWLLKHFPEQQQQTDILPVSLLLKVDDEYRSKAKAGKLPCITPKRFNPENKAWLPILHSTHEHWHFTVLYSNTERAHKLKHTFDWVIIYFDDDLDQHGQHTVVTETHGRLLGKRVVRGREKECSQYYQDNNEVS